MTGKETISLAGLSVNVTRKSSQKNLYIRVTPPDGIVTVSAPMDATNEAITHFVLRRMPEIIKVRDRMLAQLRQSKREYVSGEACYLWGKPYMMRVIYEGRRYQVEKTVNRVIMTVPIGTSEERRKKALTEWYRAELKRVFPPVLARCEERIGVRANACSVKYMKTRWGSCNVEAKRILINLQLVKKPVECLEYVLVHELVHLIERRHTNLFVSLVAKYYPAWRDAKQLLMEMPLDYMSRGDEKYEG